MLMNKLILNRIDDTVYFNDTKLTIVKQESKGTGKEVVKIAGLPGSNSQKWISLTKLQQGINEITCQGREVISTSRYTLTAEEKELVWQLQADIDAIISKAKSRYVAKPNLDVNPSEMTEEERIAKLEEIKKFYNL